VFGESFDTPDGTCIRDFIHVADLATAHVKALEYLTHKGTSTQLNLGTGTGTSIKELIKMIEEVSCRKVPHVFAPPRAGDPPILFADVQKAKETLGWRPRYDLREIVDGALRWEEYLPEFLRMP